jgi:hypothetical protein
MSTTVETAPAFNRGIVSEPSSKGRSSGPRLEFFSLKDGESSGLRFLTEGDDLIRVDMHLSVPTINPPSGSTGKWPSSMSSVCRNDNALRSIYGDCHICTNLESLIDNWGNTPKPKSRIWALAVVRERVLGDGSEELGGEAKKGKPVGFTDAVREVEVLDANGKPTGEINIEPRIVVINQALSTFFKNIDAIYQETGSILDRDFIVRRDGSSIDTTYTFIRQDESKLKPGSEGWARYENALLSQKINLDEIVAYRASDDYYGRYFVANQAAPVPAVVVTEDSNEVDGDKLESIRQRMKGYRPEVD